MTKKQKLKKIQELRETADRMEGSINWSASPSSQEWINPERRLHYMQMANEKREEANKLEKSLKS